VSVSMLRRPRFKPHLHVEVVEGAGVFLLSGTQQTVLRGRLYEVVAPCLDGRTVEEICEALRGQLTAARVFYTLRKLEQRGCLCESEFGLHAAEAALWSVQGLDPEVVSVRLAETKVSLVAFGVDPSSCRSVIESMHVRLAEQGQLEVVLTDHYLRRELESYNREALRAGRPWLLVKPVGSMIWVGPVFHPGRTGCWECLAQRIRSNYPVLGYLENVRGERGLPSTDCIQTPATLSVAGGMAANAVAAWVAHGGEFPLLEGAIQTFDTTTWSTQTHMVIRQPSCPACGGGMKPSEPARMPLVLESRKKAYTEDGGHRALSPEETLRRYSHLISPICGAVTMLEPYIPPDEDVMHVYISGTNAARGPRDFMNLRTDLRSSSSGKGTSGVQAKASALCESLERYCGMFHGDEPRRKARFVDLGEAAIHPNACMLFSEKQYEERERQLDVIYHCVPRRFDPAQELEWTPVWSLTAQTVRYLPTAFCYYDYPRDGTSDCCVPCSNGNAAGNALEESILQGFLELVERDGVALWWYNRTRMPGVDLDSFNEPYLERLAAFLKARQRDLWVLDLTTDLGIPVFAAISPRVDGEGKHIMFGFGAHLDPRIALLRAVTEMNQMLAVLLKAPPDKPTGDITDPPTLDWLQNATIADHPYLVPQEGPRRKASSYPESCTDDLKEDVLTCQKRVEQLGLEMLVLDQTRPEIGMPVVKVIVPGLRHFWARFAPGRLYDVPVKLGRIEKPLAEEELNPVLMFL